jgi:hypothetical protein
MNKMLNNLIHNLIYIFLIILLLCSNVNAIKIGEEKPSLVDTVIITNENWADCIASVDYAYHVDGIIIQTEGNKLNPDVANMVKAINPKKIVIVGGPLAVSNEVENELEKYGRIVRIWGYTRVETDGKIIRLLGANNTKVLVNGYDFDEVVAVLKEKKYSPAYSEIKILDPKNVIRVYYDNTVKIYDSQKRLMGEYRRDEVKEVPKKVIVLIKPNISTKYCNNRDIAEFGYEMVNTTNYYTGIPIDENSPTSLLLAKYLNVPVVVEDGTKPILYLDGNNSVDNSITIAVDILVLKKTKELYKKNDNLEQSLNEAKTQLWSKNIPVERYNVPYNYLKNYVEK